MPTASAEMLIKAIKLIYLLVRKDRIVVSEVADELDISRRCAHNWLLAASIVLPVYSPNEDTRLQTEPIEYKLLDDVLEFDLSLNKRVPIAMRYFERRKKEHSKDTNIEKAHKI